MDSFPFTLAEWNAVQAASHDVLNATLADDNILAETSFHNLLMVLDELRDKYGDHPVLIETEADFEADPLQRTERYRRALQLAMVHQLSTLSIRISFARVLLEDFDDTGAAQSELLACQNEMSEHEDRSTKAEWSELLAKCVHPRC